MQFESDFRFDMDDSFSMCSQAMPCPSTTGSFSSASSAYDPFTPTSRRSTPNELNIDFDGSQSSLGNPHTIDMTPSSASMSKYMFGSVKAEPEQMSFTDALPSTPMKKFDPMGTDYQQLLDLNTTPQHSLGSMTPSNSFGLYTISPETTMGPTSFLMTPTQSHSSADFIADNCNAWACNNESPINFFPQRPLPSQHDLDSLDLDRHPQSPLGRFQLNGPPSPNRMRAHRKMMVHEIQRKSTELQRAQLRASRKRMGKPEDASPVDVVRRAMCKCDYAGCNKAFRRNEHLKRHKQTYHGEGPNRFSCEFCGKDQFNRQDNLNNHRKLHARPNSRNRGVEFIPSAVAIIEQEERSRKRRAPSKAKLAAAAAAGGSDDGHDDFQ